MFNLTTETYKSAHLFILSQFEQIQKDVTIESTRSSCFITSRQSVTRKQGQCCGQKRGYVKRKRLDEQEPGLVYDFRRGASRRRASRFSGTEEKHRASVEGGNLQGIPNKHHHCMLIHKYALTTVQARVQTSCAVRACVFPGQSASQCIPTPRVSRRGT